MRYAKHEAKEWMREHAKGFVDTVATAFDPDLLIDEEGIRSDVRYLVGELGLLGVCSTGYNGERSSLSTKETIRVNAIAIDECRRVNPDSLAMPCAYHYNIQECLEIIHAAEEAGADGILLGTMFFESYSPRAMVDFFTAVADGCEIGLFLMDYPQILPVAALKELAKLPNVVGTKQVHNVFEAMEACAQEILVSPALEPDLLPSMMLHGAQFVPMVTPGHWFQAPHRKLLSGYHACALAGDYAGALALWHQLAPMRALYEECWIKPVVAEHIHPAGILKYWESLLGMNGGPVRPPLLDCPDHLKVRIREGLEAFGLIGAGVGAAA